MRWGHPRHVLAACLLGLVAWAAGTASVARAGELRFHEHRLVARIDPATDAADVLFVAIGPSAADAARAAARAESLLADPPLLLPSTPLELDLGGLAGSESVPSVLRRFTRTVRLEAAGVFRDPVLGLGFYRHVHLPGLAHALDLASALASTWVEDRAAEGNLDATLAILDARSRESVLRHARGGSRWFVAREAALQAMLPLTRPSWSRVVRELGARPDSGTWLPPLLSEVSLLRVEPARVVVRVGREGRVALAVTPGPPEDPALAASLAASGRWSIETRSLGQVVAAFDQRLADRRAAAAERVEALLEECARSLRSGDLRAALVAAREAVDRADAELGSHAPATLDAMETLAERQVEAGHLGRAAAVLEAVVSRRSEALGPDHEATIRSTHALARVLAREGRTPEALHLMERVLAGCRARYGQKDPRTHDARFDQGRLLRGLGRPEEALEQLEAALRGREATLGREHPDTLAAGADVGHVLFELGRFEESVPWLRVAVRTAGSGEASLALHLAEARLGDALRRTGSAAEAASVLARAVEGIERIAGPGDPRTLGASVALGRALVDEERYADAEPVLRRAHEGLRSMAGRRDPATRAAVAALVDLYSGWGRPKLERRYRRQLPEPARGTSG